MTMHGVQRSAGASRLRRRARRDAPSAAESSNVRARAPPSDVTEGLYDFPTDGATKPRRVRLAARSSQRGLVSRG
jgi:hypothetical protein